MQTWGRLSGVPEERDHRVGGCGESLRLPALWTKWKEVPLIQWQVQRLHVRPGVRGQHQGTGRPIVACWREAPSRHSRHRGETRAAGGDLQQRATPGWLLSHIFNTSHTGMLFEATMWDSRSRVGESGAAGMNSSPAVQVRQGLVTVGFAAYVSISAGLPGRIRMTCSQRRGPPS